MHVDNTVPFEYIHSDWMDIPTKDKHIGGYDTRRGGAIMIVSLPGSDDDTYR